MEYDIFLPKFENFLSVLPLFSRNEKVKVSSLLSALTTFTFAFNISLKICIVFVNLSPIC